MTAEKCRRLQQLNFTKNFCKRAQFFVHVRFTKVFFAISAESFGYDSALFLGLFIRGLKFSGNIWVQWYFEGFSVILVILVQISASFA